MKYTNLLKEFVVKKVDLITEKGLSEWPENFLQICLEILDTYGEEKCKEIFFHEDFSWHECPYCVYHKELIETGCRNCEFGINFGNCYDSDSFFKKIDRMAIDCDDLVEEIFNKGDVSDLDV